MKIIVLMKQVASKDAVLRISGDEKWINEADIAQQTNESDGYALEEALRGATNPDEFRLRLAGIQNTSALAKEEMEKMGGVANLSSLLTRN